MRTSIKLTGSVGLVALLFWILFQFFVATDGLLKWITGIVFLVSIVAVIIDAANGGLSD